MSRYARTGVAEVSRVSATAGCLLVIAVSVQPSFAIAQEPRFAANELADLSLEELSSVRVTSVTRTEQTLDEAAAAIAVVSSEDIERSGATSVPEALRMVPGIHVARQNASTWAVSSRGFSNANSRNLLVQSDTRSIYTPLFSGVFWDVQDYLLEDISHIEVVRGPGAALWGSNAVNGVISITTKNARDTQGTYAEAIVGTEEQGAAARYGGRTDGGVYYRVFAQHTEHDESYASGTQSDDDWHLSHIGFRSDWTASPDDTFTLQGDIYQGQIGQLAPAVRVIGRPGPQGDLEVDVNGGNLLGRWKHRIDDRSDFQLRAYYDRTYRDDPSFEDSLDTFDIDFQHRIELGSRHELLWGLNYRYTANHNEGKGIFEVVPSRSEDSLTSVFLQDQIRLTDALELTLGTKAEHNEFSGFELQPSARLAWGVAPGHTTWAAVSRAVRVPTRYERDIRVDATDPAGDPVIRLVGNDDFGSEELTAYEVGYRWQATDRLSFDLAAFHNRYDGLSSIEFGEAFVEPGGRTVIPLTTENLGSGRSQGFEAMVSYAPLPYWRLLSTYSYIDLHLDSSGDDLNRGRYLEGSTPQHQAGIRSSLDWRAYQFDVQLRYSDEIRRQPGAVTGGDIDAYTEMDIRLAHRFGEQLTVSLVGQNLLDSQHPEFGVPGQRGEVERRVYAKAAWDF